MISLLQNEWMKARKKHRAGVFLIVMGALLVIAALLVLFYSNRFNLRIGGMQYTIYSASIYTTIVSFYSIVIGASVLTSEYNEGTIKQLFIRSHSRTSILLSKYLIVNLLALTLYFILIGFNFFLGLLFFQYDQIFNALTNNIINGLYHYPNILFYITLAFMIGALTKSMGLATGLTFLAKFSSGPITLLVSMYDWGKYVIFPHLSLSSYSDNRMISGGMDPFLSDLSLGFSLFIIVIYLLVLLIPSILVTEKRDII
ncbi:hypothetical protein GCM10008967_13420 [Bacillus carboniphilus]|uniref:ABC transporter permease n=1 Tax=Bacillus carboniphilus TaxID=86663 RepID=A0ABN0W3L6_9BACI